jgi:predicted aldo/keto reductase-like oxidoreductase
MDITKAMEINKEEQKVLDELKAAIKKRVDEECRKYWETCFESLKNDFNMAEAYERNMPKPDTPLNRVENRSHSMTHTCLNCGSTSHKTGFLGLFGERVCDNTECGNSIRKFK